MPIKKKPRVPTEFGRLLLGFLKKSGLSEREFANRVGRPNTIVNRVIYGERRPNPTWMPEWSSALVLSEHDALLLFDAAREARAKGKSDSAQFIEELTERIDLLEKAILDLTGMLKDPERLRRLGEQGGLDLPYNVQKALYAIMLGKPKP